MGKPDEHSCEENKKKTCACRQKNTPRDDELKKDLERRINRASGQLQGIKSMIEENRYCGDILIQLAAVESAIKSLSGIVLQNHLETCVVEQVQAGNTEIIDEVMKLFRKFS